MDRYVDHVAVLASSRPAPVGGGVVLLGEVEMTAPRVGDAPVVSA